MHEYVRPTLQIKNCALVSVLVMGIGVTKILDSLQLDQEHLHVYNMYMQEYLCILDTEILPD